MSGRTNVILMTPESNLASAVAHALQGNGHVLDAVRPHTPRELLAQLSQSAPGSLILVDLDASSTHHLLVEIERIIARFPGSRFVGLADELGSDLLLEAMQAGLRRVVSKRALATDLHTALERLTSGATAPGAANGDVLTVLSASGGCGATTIAINLTQELAAQGPASRTLLVDMDCHYGAAATYLGLEPRYGLDQVLSYSGPIDSELLTTTATTVSDSLHLLASPASVRFSRPEPLDFSRLDQALQCARRAYRHTVIDAPRATMDVAATLAAASGCTLLVFQLTVKDIRTARHILDALRERGVPSSTIVPVANRYAKRQMIGLDEAAKALGGSNVLHLRNDYAAAIEGVNYGKSLGEVAPRSPLRKDLQSLLTTTNARRPS